MSSGRGAPNVSISAPATAVLILATMLAGCSNSDPGRQLADAGVPTLAQADASAQAWDAKRGLAALFAIESANPEAARPHDFDDDFYTPLFQFPDSTVGDGRAHCWLAIYAVSDITEKRLEILIDGAGQILEQRETSTPAPAMLPPGLNIITEALAEQLNDLSPGWNAGNANAGMLLWSLQGGDDPAWALDGALNTEGKSMSFIFDAHTGARLQATVEGADLVQKESGSGEGNINLLTGGGQRSHLLVLNNPHREIAVSVTVTGMTGGEVQVFLEDPGGNETEFGGNTGLVQPAPKGSWHIIVRGGGPAGVAYTFDWCAPGDSPEQAC